MSSERRKARAAWWGTLALFLIHGSLVATWVSRIPTVQSALKLNNAVLGLTLLASAVGAVIVIPAAGWLVTRYGSKRMSILSGSSFCLAVFSLATANTAFTLGLALFFYGASAATMDVSMNAQGVEVEKTLGGSTMSRFHAMFSSGGMIGAALGGLLAEHGVTTLRHFSASAALNLIAILLVMPLLLETHDVDLVKGRRLAWRKIPPRLASPMLHRVL